MTTDKRFDEIIRVKKCPGNFVTMNKSFLEDSRLSFKAKGILAYLLSKPDNWKVIVGNVVNACNDGKSSIYAGLKELKKYGYYKKVPIRNEQGTRIIRWESAVYEVPCSLLSDYQKVEDEEKENQFLENQEHNYNNTTNKLDNNNNHVTSCQMEIKQETQIVEPTTEVNEKYDKIVEAVIKTNIDYGTLKKRHKTDIGLINEFVSIMVDFILSKGKSVFIHGAEKPRTLVKSALLKLTDEHIEYVLSQYKKQYIRIKKKRQYILSMLYHSSMELEAWMVNDIQANSSF